MMKIKAIVITDNLEYLNALKDISLKDNSIILDSLSAPPDFEEVSKKKYDIIVFDDAILSNWFDFHQSVKNYNINNIFITILTNISLEDIKKAFKEGIYDIVRKDAKLKEFINTYLRAIETVKILKSTEKIHRFCEHSIEINIPSDVNLVNETVNQIIDTAKIGGFIKERNNESNIKLALTEAVVNAIVHGNKSDINKKVFIKAKVNSKELYLSIEDCGKGFDASALNNPLDEENILNTSGRGIYLIKTIMDEVLFEKNGAKIILIKRREG